MISKWFKRNNPKLDILADFGLRLDYYVSILLILNLDALGIIVLQVFHNGQYSDCFLL